MTYLGLCGKYGEGKMFLLAYAAPPILNAAFQIAKSAPAEHIMLTTLIALGGAQLGFTAATMVHRISDRILSHRGIGLTRGAKITKRFQAAAYALPISLALIFSVVSDPGQKDIQTTSNNVNHIHHMETAGAPRIKEQLVGEISRSLLSYNPFPMPISP